MHIKTGRRSHFLFSCVTQKRLCLRSQLFHPTFLWLREKFPSLNTSNCALIFLCVLVAIEKMTDVLSGESVSDLFQGFLKKHSPDSFISIKFGQNGGTTLNMVAESKEEAEFWVRGLRKLIVNKGLFISNKRFLSMLTAY